jgi:hypothetical protein
MRRAIVSTSWSVNFVMLVPLARQGQGCGVHDDAVARSYPVLVGNLD